MANEFISPVEILQDSLIMLENELGLLKHVNREFDDKVQVENEKVGYTINARVPVRVRGRQGDAARPEDVKEKMVPVTVNRLWGSDLKVSDQDLAMVIDRFRQRYIEPGINKIGNDVEGEGYDLYKQFYNIAGVPGTATTDLTTLGSSRALLNLNSVPQMDRSFLMDPITEMNLLGYRNNLFNPVAEISRQYKEGSLGPVFGFKVTMGQNVATHTTGTVSATSAPVVATAPANGDTSIATSNWTANSAILKEGDIVSFAGANGVNYISYRDIRQLRTFRVTADVTADGSGNATIPVFPAFNADSTDSEQTITALPAVNALVKVHGLAYAQFTNVQSVASSQSLCIHRDAMTFVAAKLEMPGGLDWSEQITHKKLGIALRLTRGFDMMSNTRLTRLETLGGWAVLRPELGLRYQA